MRTIGEKIVKSAFTFSACKNNQDSIFFQKNSENESLKDMTIYQKKQKQIEGLGAL